MVSQRGSAPCTLDCSGACETHLFLGLHQRGDRYERIRNRFTRGLFSLFLFGLAIPLQATIIPIYAMITAMHLYDTLFALILPSVAFGIPLSVLVLVTYIRDIPNELHESMYLDGAGHFHILRSLVLPLSRPALVTVIIYETIQIWNGFLFPLVLTQRPGYSCGCLTFSHTDHPALHLWQTPVTGGLDGGL